MNLDKIHNKELYYRLIALWVVCEAFAGGIMHATKIPFTGMIVSSLAVTCIILIAYYVPSKSSIIKATIIVAIFKLLLSPHSPPTAYIAVFFQGYLGHLLFFNRRYFTWPAIILSVFALVESAIQRILVLLILYGNNFWYAVDQYVQKLVGGHDRNYSLLIALGYILLHAVAGIFIGIFAVRLVKRSGRWRSNYSSFLIDKKLPSLSDHPVKQRKKKIKWIFVILWLLLVLLFIQAYADPANSVLPAGIVFRILLRSLLIVLSWYLIFAPLIMQLIKRALRSQQMKQQLPANEIMQLIPQTKYIFTQSWSLSGKESGIKRIKLFLKILVMNILWEGSNETRNHK